MKFLANFVSNYSTVPYNTMPAVTPTPGEFPCQPPVHMVPTYYPQPQPGIQPPPVMYRVPTPPNTPNSTQVRIFNYLKTLKIVNK